MPLLQPSTKCGRERISYLSDSYIDPISVLIGRKARGPNQKSGLKPLPHLSKLTSVLSEKRAVDKKRPDKDQLTLLKNGGADHGMSDQLPTDRNRTVHIEI